LAGHASHALLASHTGHASHAGHASLISGLWCLGSGFRSLSLGRLGRLGRLLLSAGGQGQCKQGGNENGMLHFKILYR
jgi:hypothetical protein